MSFDKFLKQTVLEIAENEDAREENKKQVIKLLLEGKASLRSPSIEEEKARVSIEKAIDILRGM